jgi:DNA-3-methyladenine glycosylase II
MAFTETFSVKALAPFDFDLTAQIFRSGDKQIRIYANRQFNQVLNINSKLAQVEVTSSGTVEQPKISVELKSTSPLTLSDKQKAKETIKFIFNLDFNLNSFYRDVEKDQIMHQITQQLYGLKKPTTPTIFEALVDSIIEQQISIKVAHTIEERLVKKFGETLTLDGETCYAYPTPQNIACASINEIQSCGLTERKAQYIQGTAQLIMKGKLDLENIKNQTDPEKIISELDEIRGICVWTAELTMLRGMQKLYALPADDFGIRRVISKYFCAGKPIKTADAREIAKAWGKWKGLAAFYLIIAEAKSMIV